VNAIPRRARALAWPLGIAALAVSVAMFALTADIDALGATWRNAASAPAELLAVLAAYGLAFALRALVWSRVVPMLRPGDALAAALTAHALTTGYALLGGAVAVALPGRVGTARPWPVAAQSPRAR
jgi:hypothetical protein